jgi:hypothetical protein
MGSLLKSLFSFESHCPGKEISLVERDKVAYQVLN